MVLCEVVEYDAKKKTRKYVKKEITLQPDTTKEYVIDLDKLGRLTKYAELEGWI